MPFTYGTLCQRHPSYDEKLLRCLDDLYAGGFQIMRRAKDYLPAVVNEDPARYNERIQLATYQPYMGQIVDQFASDLFAQTFEITPAADANDSSTPGEDTVDAYYTDFAKDADGKGHAFVDVLGCLLKTALTQGKSILCVDAPSPEPGDEPTSKADEDEKGLSRPYVYELPLSCLIDWDTDEDGDFTWAIVRQVEQRRKTPGGSRNEVTETFTVWGFGADGKAAWERYAITYDPQKSPPQNETDVPRVEGAGGGGATSFDAIPIHVLELPDGLWVGNKIGPPALEHFRRRSQLNGAQNRSLVSIPVAALGPESGPLGGEGVSDAQTDPSRGDDPARQFARKGFMVVGKGDEVYFAEPSGAGYELVDTQLKELRDDIFAVCHQMAASVRTNSTALGRSGLSKQADKDSTAKVLTALGRIVRQFALEIYSCISTARGEDIKWSAHGLDSYEPDDREQMLEEAVSTAQVDIPSPTFRKLWLFRLIQRLIPHATSQDLDKIRGELEDGVDAHAEMDDLEAEAKKAMLQNPQPATAPPTAKLPPNGKPPAVKQPSPPR